MSSPNIESQAVNLFNDRLALAFLLKPSRLLAARTGIILLPLAIVEPVFDLDNVPELQTSHCTGSPISYEVRHFNFGSPRTRTGAEVNERVQRLCEGHVVQNRVKMLCDADSD